MSLMLSQPRIESTRPVEPTASFEPSKVRPGATATLRIVFNALQETIRWDGKLPAPEKLEVTPGAKAQVLQMMSTNLEPRTTFNFHVVANEPGIFVVPEFSVTVDGKSVKVPPATLEVTPSAPATSAQRLSVEVVGTNVYVGQPVSVRVISPAGPGGLLLGLSQVQIIGEGFIVDQTAARQRVETVQTGPILGPAFIFETVLTPITAGKLSLMAQAYAIGNRSSGPTTNGSVFIYGGSLQYTLLDSGPAEFEVRPLPRAGQLPGFTGSVGSYTAEPPKLASTELKVGEPVRMIVVVRGEGSLSHLVPPPPPRLPDWQVFLGTNDNLPPQIIQAQGFVRINYTLVPMSDQVKETPAIPFSCFDPKKGTYADLTIVPVPVTVKAGAVPVDYGSLARADAADEKQKEPVLSGLAATPGLGSASLVPLQMRPWFPAVQLAPAALFFGLWGWDRRRRYLERHPDVVLRRQARRALRQQTRLLHKAARRRDIPAFSSAAVNGFRVACAPHYPAEPRALVCADVLPLLPEGDRSGPGGDVVRHVFEINDASRFSDSANQPGDLLNLQPEIERVFEKLRERL